MSSGPPSPRAIATDRTPGIDVARALAVLGMVVVNYDAMLAPGDLESKRLIWVGERFEGRAAALFVLIAGMGVSLLTRQARQTPTRPLGPERRALLKRAAVLLVIGLLLIHLWPWDILHFYAFYLAIAVALLRARSWQLWLGALLSVAGAAVLQLGFDYDEYVEFWTPLGLLCDLVFDGLHPIFPWMAFLLVGMWVGRQDVRDRRVRRRLLIWALVAAALGEGLSLVAHHLVGLSDESPWLMLTGSWPRPPSPVYVLAATGTAIAVVCLCIAVTEPRPAARWVVALTATGQMAFTLYLGHAVAVLIPQAHGWLEETSVAVAWAYGLSFYAAAVAFSWWWRRRWSHGPLEGLIRQVAGHADAAPWGGALIPTRRFKRPPPKPRFLGTSQRAPR